MTHNKTGVTRIEKEGWVRRFTVENHRVSEYVEVYEMLGEEVRVEPCIPDEKEACQVCFTTECNNYRTIYTRPKYDSSGDELGKKHRSDCNEHEVR